MLFVPFSPTEKRHHTWSSVYHLEAEVNSVCAASEHISCCSLDLLRFYSSWHHAPPPHTHARIMWSQTYSTSYLCILGCVPWRRAGAVPRWRHGTIQGQDMLREQSGPQAGTVRPQGQSSSEPAHRRWSLIFLNFCGGHDFKETKKNNKKKT